MAAHEFIALISMEFEINANKFIVFENTACALARTSKTLQANSLHCFDWSSKTPDTNLLRWKLMLPL